MAFRSFTEGSNSANRVIPYSDPYSSIAQFNMPPSVKSTMVLSRRLFLTNEIVFPAIWRYASYGITDLKFEAATPTIRKDWETLYTQVLKVKQFDLLLELDRTVYGNGMASLVIPFDKWLICPACNFESMAKFTKYKFNAAGQFDYQGNCMGCRRKVTYEVEDRPLRRAWNRLRLMRWPPLSMDIDHNPYYGQTEYYHRIPREIRAQLAAGNQLLSSTLSIEFIKAARLGKRIKIEKDNFFHTARPTISDTRVSFGAWGMPLLQPVANRTYSRAILIRAQEAMAQNRILPLRMVWPLMGNQPVAVGGINLGNWRGRMEEEVKIWMRDPNYIGISPIPIGMGTIGADARPMLLSQEIEQISQEIVRGMGIPTSFVFGGQNYSGASIELRALENFVYSDRVELEEFNDGFLRSRIQTYLDWPYCRSSFTDLRAADDMQRLQILDTWNQRGILSNRSLLEEGGFDSEQQKKQRRLELDGEYEVQKLTAKNQAEAQGLAQVIATRFQYEAQQTAQDLAQQAHETAAMDTGAMFEPTEHEAVSSDISGDNSSGVDPRFGQWLNGHSQEMASMPPDQQQAQLREMQKTNPGYAEAVRRRSVDMRPLPEQRPPRRDQSPI